jgi:F420-0:gamma-glutamyl ligase
VSELRLAALASKAMVQRDDDLVMLLLEAMELAGEELRHHDLVVVTSKVVSKSEGVRGTGRRVRRHRSAQGSDR